MISVILLLLPLASSLIQPAKASSDHWDECWHGGIYENYPGYPENVSTTITVYSDDESQWVKIALVVSVYQYEPYVDDDIVVLRVALYYDSFADETMLPVPAAFVTLNVQKDTDGSNFYDQAMEVRYSGVRPGFAQGSGLDQSSYLDSTQDDREWWALKTLEYGAGLYFEGLGVVTGMISLASAWVPQAGPDYMDAGYSDYGLYSWWHDPGYDFDLENPVRQYALNSIQWTQNYGVNPSKFFGIKVWAHVVLHTQNNLIGSSIDTAPVYLRIARSGGGGGDGGGGGGLCPTLFVWNGTDYIEEGILDIHAESDVKVQREIQNSLALQNYVYKLQLRELDNFTSHIDQVKLYAIDNQGKRHLCPLTYAYQNELGQVTWRLFFDDEKRVDLTPTQTIDIKFLPSIPYSLTVYFIFEINGYNPKGFE